MCLKSYVYKIILNIPILKSCILEPHHYIYIYLLDYMIYIVLIF